MDELVALVGQYRDQIERAVVFAGVLLLVSLGLRLLLRRVVFAFFPQEKQSRARGRTTSVSPRLAVADLIAWSVGFFFACEVVDLDFVVQVVAVLIAPLPWVLGGLAVAAVAAYSWSPAGNELLLSLLGWLQLRRDLKRRGAAATYDFGEGRQARLDDLGLLHSSFRLGSGEAMVSSNAAVMRDVFRFGRQPARLQRSQAAPPTGAPPPPPPSA